MADSSPAAQPLQGREIVVGICGGIACYKVADLVSKLVQAGAGVTVAMTADAQKFVTPLTFQALTGRPVHTNIWATEDSGDVQHIKLTEKADLMLVAPATATTIARIAAGLCDDLVALLVAAAACPVMLAPSMNDRMWTNPIAQRNVRTLTEAGYTLIGPDAGWLACRNVGAGRMSEPAAIFEAVINALKVKADNSRSPS
jgi:phosphopantothenoylcysteine decarboxylase/phosphopantothenate--cysteine ligase